MNFPRVVIIILNWNGLRDTLECLESVFKLNYPNFKVILVDNGSSDGSVIAIRRNYPLTVVLENRENLGYAGGNNIGMRYGMENCTDYVWLLNNDTVVEEETLKKLVETGEKSHAIGLVSPVIYYYDFPEKIQYCGSFVDWTTHSIVHCDANHFTIDNDFVNRRDVCLWGTALLIKSYVIKRIGYLEEKFYAYHEDFDYSIRSIKAGFQNLLEIKAKIYHKVPLHRNAHYFYFMARNECFLWVQNLRGLEKLSYYKQYLAKRLWEHADLRHSGYDECADACLEGTWAGMLDVGGGWDRNLRVPNLLKRIFSWHPYFWARLFRGNFLKYALKFLKGRKWKFGE